MWVMFLTIIRQCRKVVFVLLFSSLTRKKKLVCATFKISSPYTRCIILICSAQICVSLCPYACMANVKYNNRALNIYWIGIGVRKTVTKSFLSITSSTFFFFISSLCVSFFLLYVWCLLSISSFRCCISICGKKKLRNHFKRAYCFKALPATETFAIQWIPE